MIIIPINLQVTTKTGLETFIMEGLETFYLFIILFILEFIYLFGSLLQLMHCPLHNLIYHVKLVICACLCTL